MSSSLCLGMPRARSVLLLVLLDDVYSRTRSVPSACSEVLPRPHACRAVALRCGAPRVALLNLLFRLLALNFSFSGADFAFSLVNVFMSTTNLGQAEADELTAMLKRKETDENYTWLGLCNAVTIPLSAVDNSEKFLLDLRQSAIMLSKRTYHNRARGCITLLRLDIGGRPHKNPDGVKIECPHLHRYREGYGDRWAEQLPARLFGDLSDPGKTLQEFMKLCCVVDPPRVVLGFFA